MAMESFPDLKDVELICLAKEIPHSSYTELNEALGFSFTEGQNVLASHQTKYREATEQILHNWKIRQTDPSQSRHNLSQKLIKISIGEQGIKLSKGEYLQSQDELGNREALPVPHEPEEYENLR